MIRQSRRSRSVNGWRFEGSDSGGPAVESPITMAKTKVFQLDTAGAGAKLTTSAV